MAIDPTAPVTPIPPAAPPGSQPHSVVLQAMARAALANTAGKMGELAGRPGPDAPTPRQGVEQADKSSTQDAGRPAVSSSSGGGSSAAAPRSPPQESRLLRAVRLAATEAVPRQAGLAPLMADVRAVLERPDTPPEVRGAGEDLLARLPRAFEIATARGLKKAVEQSGVFLEARLAKTSSTEGAAAPAFPATDLKAVLLVFKGKLSDWLVRATPVEQVKEPEPAERLLGPPPEADDAVQDAEAQTPTSVISPHSDSQDTEEGAKTSALTTALETPLEASEQTQPPSGSSKSLSPTQAEEDVQVARPVTDQPSVVEDDAVEPRFAAFLAPSRSPPLARASQPVSPMLGLLEFAEVSLSHEERRPPAPIAARGYGAVVADPGKPSAPPPPFADGPMAGQRPMPSHLPVLAAPEEIVRRLLKGASAALARQDLMQIASLQEVHHDPETGEARPQPARLNLDVPFVTPQGVAVAQFEITRDGGGAGGSLVGPVERTYRARFSIDVEPLGPVHALVTLTGSRTRVSLWAERAETIARLRAGEEGLGAALRQAELNPEVSIHSGPPPVKDASALGHFVDQAS
ncbi:flagellar hook-length control protein FliK [Caulobacter segnis]|uniref:ABC transporter ATP-binding protein n=2 Tax=Caulobacter segnis TaxID=88688 RepID=D5VJX9_CAUST|nr:flagellar hook-length control protein FliK [Caulobacter segnis]ADG10658.1 ABC transporter ATP-binding protein [Caulobacter segnis ATCC 21756]AVQ02372.1 flagellar hook-length control protein FliK [Caulobacter segnis]